MESKGNKNLLYYIIGIIFLLLLIFNFQKLTGQTIVKSKGTSFPQESRRIIREITILTPNPLKVGDTLHIKIVPYNTANYIDISKEKLYITDNKGGGKKRIPLRCRRGLTTKCTLVDASYKTPTDSEKGSYGLQIENEIDIKGKAITEILGEKIFRLN